MTAPKRGMIASPVGTANVGVIYMPSVYNLLTRTQSLDIRRASALNRVQLPTWSARSVARWAILQRTVTSPTFVVTAGPAMCSSAQELKLTKNSEEGHHSRECEKPRNAANVTCRNCETRRCSYWLFKDRN